jgi:hypothetical protein
VGLAFPAAGEPKQADEGDLPITALQSGVRAQAATRCARAAGRDAIGARDKLKNGRGIWGKNALQGAPVLDFLG